MYKFVLQPLRRFSAEVLGSIFEMASNLEPNFNSSPTETYLPGSPTSTVPPWSLSHVCSRWREVAISYPQLWSSISMALGTSVRGWRNVDRGLESAMFFISRQLKRSRDCPLTLALDISHTLQYGSLSRALLLSLTAHSNQWRDVLIKHTVLNEKDLVLFESIGGALSSLRTLRIFYQTQASLPEQRIHAFEYAPKLTELWLTCPSSMVKNLYFPWSQITHLCLSTDAQQSLILLSKMPNLISCVLEVSSVSAGLLPQDVPLQLASLKLLTFNFQKYLPNPQQILDRISVPALESLEFMGSCMDVDQGLADALSHFIQRSQNALKNFKLWTRKSQSVDVVSILRVLPASVTSLSLQVNPTSYGVQFGGDIVIQAFRRSPEGYLCLPFLQTLHLHSTGITTDILDVLESRRELMDGANRAIQSLKYLSLSGYGVPNNHFLSDHRAITLQNDGLVLRVSLEIQPPEPQPSYYYYDGFD
ncbi:hypothetical protein BT96DRAFT_103297 [Gymnopus androsaceus JB14]|uniref:Uncharacterized protein n=1 Tax=Gymnopus androsaceus JB14 TaxID=1447944 RepID=A0A6A4IF95_9AGAR|nr:hypothetical protein BT96DRAFT_103297 [Gymnopus androsaceus JB14]